MSKAPPKAGPPQPPPLLLCAPLPLPDRFQGDYSGAQAIYNGDRVLEFGYVQEVVTAAIAPDQAALDKRRVIATLMDPATVRAFNKEQDAINRRYYAAVAAYLVHECRPGPTGTPDDPTSWETLSLPVLKWLAIDGYLLAAEGLTAPFTLPESAS